MIFKIKQPGTFHFRCDECRKTNTITFPLAGKWRIVCGKHPKELMEIVDKPDPPERITLSFVGEQYDTGGLHGKGGNEN